MSTEDEVRNASKQFYAGLNRMANGDAASFDAPVSGNVCYPMQTAEKMTRSWKGRSP